jgi:hypothetical protein
MDLNVCVSDGIAAKSVGPGGPPPKKDEPKGPVPEAKDDDLASKFTARLFEGVQLFARGPASAFSTCLLTA